MFDAKEFEMEKKKNAEIMDQLSEKTRQLKNLQMMFDKLKRKASVEIHQQLIAADSMHHEIRDSYDQLSHSYDQRKTGYSSRPNLNPASSSLSVKGFLKNVNFKR